MNVKILNMFGSIEEIKISADMWRELHFNKREYYFRKENKVFLDKHNLKPTIFNLNCLKGLSGVILTDAQILKFNNMKGGLKE